ncbi:MAG: hypothetical protein OES46_01395 [Gammaproteobacteria bacterium]|jgi:hypothetical protein|nr:hypothetical protein [Gammaproteobacteria bacterium]
MPGFDMNRLELIAKKYLDQANGDRRTAAQLLRRRVDSNVALKLGIMELLVEPATWDLMRQAATDPKTETEKTDTEPIQEKEQQTSSAKMAVARKQFEGHIKKMRILPLPGTSRKRELVNRFEDLKDRVTATLGRDCKLSLAIDAAVHSRRRTDIRHVLAVYESQPYVVLDRIWSANSKT